MPIFRVTSPDGRTIEVNAPEGATEEQAIKYAQDNWESIVTADVQQPSQPQKPERDTTESALRALALTGKAAYTGLTAIPGLAADVIASPYNLAASGANRFGANLPQSRPSRALADLGERLYPVTPETTGERLSADAISAVGSGATMLRAGQSLSGVGGTTGRVGATLASQPALQLAGAGAAGLAAGTTREAGGGQGAQMAAGLAAGFSPIVAIKGFNLSHMIASPVYKSVSVVGKQGKINESGDILRRLAENEPTQIQDAFAKRTTYLQGQKPTTEDVLAQYKLKTGETVGTGLVKLQATLKTLPETSGKLQTIDTNRLESYGNVIGKIAGTDDKMKVLVAARTKATSKLYDLADNAQTQVDDELRGLISRIPAKAMADAKELALLKGTPLIGIDDTGILAADTQVLNGMSLKHLIKGLTARANDINVDPAIRNSSGKLADELYAVLQKTNPYAVRADKLYAEFSNPINRMEVGRLLSDKLKNASLADTPGAFLKAGEDAAKTIKNATGMSGLKTFEQMMTPKEIHAIKAVSKDMERMLEARRIANRSTLQDAGSLAEASQFKGPSILSTPVVFTKWVLSMIGKDVSPEINKILADTLANPEKVAIILKNTPKEKIPALMEAANKFAAGGVAGTAPTLQGQQQ